MDGNLSFVKVTFDEWHPNLPLVINHLIYKLGRVGDIREYHRKTKVALKLYESAL